ncbi:MAG: AAA family ATPase, partial [Myxococcales bacterium]|nr:AAA family ATPase [Myxococcales bacterium]
AAVRAEQARQAALVEAAQARSEAERLLAESRASAEEQRGAVADRRAVWAAARVTAARDSTAWRALAQRAAARLEDPGLPVDEADRLYDELVAALIEARLRFNRAMDDMGEPAGLPKVNLPLDVDEGRFRVLSAERDAVIQARQALVEERKALARQIEDGRSADVIRLALDVEGLNTGRLGLLPRLSVDKRARVLGLGSEGLEQLARELSHLQLSTRWYLHHRPVRLAEIPGQLLDALGHKKLRWEAFQAVGLFLLGLVFAIRRRHWLELLDGSVARWRGGLSERRWAARAWPHARALVPAGVMWAVTVWGFAAANRILPDTEVRVLGEVAVMVATYRLIIAVVHRAMVWLAGTPLTPVDPEISQRLLRSVRIVGRYILVVQAFLTVAEVILGRGYLYTVVEEFAWIGGFPIGLWLLRHWHPDLVAAYEGRSPNGWLVPWIRRSEGRWWRLIFAAPAFVHVAIGVLARNVVRLSLRVGRIRRALAYLFRRRLERAAGSRVVASAGPALPAETRARLVAPVSANTRIERFPCLAETLTSIAEWREGEAGGPVAVVGARGIGKSTWLAELKARHPEATLLRMSHAPQTAGAAVAWLAEGLGLPHTSDPNALAQSLREGPRRVVLVDDAHHFLRRAPGGIEVLSAVLSVLRRSARRVFWVWAQARYMAAYQRFALRGVDVFRAVHTLHGWSEDGLAELVDKRLEDAGLTAVWDDLMIEPERTYEREEQRARTRERYLRLLWDHVDGVPGTALHFFARSLVADVPGQVRVRLFEHPRADDLENLGDLGRFVLNAVVLHDGLDGHEAPSVLQLPALEARATLEQLEALGCLEIDPADGRWFVPDDWYPAALRFLRRKNLLHV